MEEVNESGKRASDRRGKEIIVAKKPKVPQRKGPMNLYMFQEPNTLVQSQQGVKLRQTNIHDACDKEARFRTHQYIAIIPFNSARLDNFKHMIEEIGRHSSKLKPASYHELRVPHLKNKLEYTNYLMKGHKGAWTKHVC